MADLRAQLAALQTERDTASANAARLTQQLERLAISDDDRRDPPPPDPYDREHDVKLFEKATKLAHIQAFSGDRKRITAFCAEISRLLDTYGMLDSPEGFLYATGRLSGDARIWYEYLMQTSPVFTWEKLETQLKEEYHSETTERDARKVLDALSQTGTVAQFCVEFRRVIMLLPDMPDAEKRYQFRKKLCSGMRNKISELDWKTVQEMMAKVQQIASRMDEHLTMPQAANLAAAAAANSRADQQPATSFQGVCYNCDMPGHRARYCPGRNVQAAPRS